jgi:hypothetical protein
MYAPFPSLRLSFKNSKLTAHKMAYMAPNANFFPAALPNDGTIDLVCIDGNISRITALKSLAAVESDTFYDMEHVSPPPLAYNMTTDAHVCIHPLSNANPYFRCPTAKSLPSA